MDRHNAPERPGPPRAADAFSSLAVQLHDAATVDDTAAAIAQYGRRLVHCDFAGVVVMVERARPEIGAVTHPVVTELYEAQLTSGDGPLMTAMQTGEMVSVPDVASESRWPSWQRVAADAGLGSVLHVPLIISHRTVGALSLYRVAAGGFTDEEQALATVLAQHATVALDAARQERRLELAADSRRSVGLAVGILMERFGFDSGKAFGVLQRYSQDTNIKLREVADYLIATRELPPPDRS